MVAKTGYLSDLSVLPQHLSGLPALRGLSLPAKWRNVFGDNARLQKSYTAQRERLTAALGATAARAGRPPPLLVTTPEDDPGGVMTERVAKLGSLTRLSALGPDADPTAWKS